MMDKREAPIAVFDSGMGGVSVLREPIKRCRKKIFIILVILGMHRMGQRVQKSARTHHCTYRRFYENGSQGDVVIACNTATSAAARLAPHVPGTAAGRDRAGGQTGSRKVSSGQYPCDGDTDHDPGRKTASFD